MDNHQLTEEAISYAKLVPEITWTDTLVQNRIVTNAFEAGFKKALELVLEMNMITEVHDCETVDQLLAWI